MYAELLRAFVSKDTSIQKEIDAKPDGKWGPATERAALNALDAAWSLECGRRGWAFRKVGRQVPRRPEPHLLIWHWPGSTRNADELAASWKRNEGASNVSSNCGIDEHRIIWYAAPHMRTNHTPVPLDAPYPSGYFNNHSIGIDICAPVLAQHAANARSRDLYVGEDNVRIPAPGGKFHSHRQLGLHAAMAIRARKVREELEAMLGPFYSTDHHMLDPSRKWDVRGLWEAPLRRHNVIDPDDARRILRS